MIIKNSTIANFEFAQDGVFKLNNFDIVEEGNEYSFIKSYGSGGVYNL